MKLSELKTGMIVTTREGKEYVVYRDFACSMTGVSPNVKDTDSVFVNGNEKGWLSFFNYNEDMINLGGFSSLDIMKVEMPSHPYGFADLNFNRDCRTLLWVREDVQKLSTNEVAAMFGLETQEESLRQETDLNHYFKHHCQCCGKELSPILWDLKLINFAGVTYNICIDCYNIGVKNGTIEE